MPIVSKAIARLIQANWDGTEREDRIFKRPDGTGFTRASYDDENTPDDQPQEEPAFLQAEHAAILIKLIMNENLEDLV